jgi:hypothetical protein
MRLLVILIEILIGCGVLYFIGDIVKTTYFNKKNVNLVIEHINSNKSADYNTLLSYYDELINLSENHLTSEILKKLSEVRDNLKIMLEDKEYFDNWKKLNIESYNNLNSIFMKYLPEAITRYLSIPEKFRNTQHRNGKNPNQLFEESVFSLSSEFEKINNEFISTKINNLKNYQTFIHKKFDTDLPEKEVNS